MAIKIEGWAPLYFGGLYWTGLFTWPCWNRQQFHNKKQTSRNAFTSCQICRDYLSFFVTSVNFTDLQVVLWIATLDYLIWNHGQCTCTCMYTNAPKMRLHENWWLESVFWENSSNDKLQMFCSTDVCQQKVMYAISKSNWYTCIIIIIYTHMYLHTIMYYNIMYIVHTYMYMYTSIIYPDTPYTQ